MKSNNALGLSMAFACAVSACGSTEDGGIGADLPSTPEAEAVGTVNSELQAHLAAFPGGVQVSDNTIAYGNGSALVVFPDPGEEFAPNGLGSNVRVEAARSLGLVVLDEVVTDDLGFGTTTAAIIPDSWQGIVKNCPNGWFCFFDADEFRGKKWQFSDAGKESADNWGFDNRVTSWVNNGHKNVNTYDDYSQKEPLWYMQPNSKVSNVGTNYNDKLSSFEAY